MAVRDSLGRLPTRDEAASQISYDPETGKFFRNGRECTSAHSGGYLTVCLFRRNYFSHRVAWLISTGYWPKNEIDHVNGCRTDNRLCNLREATRSQNGINRPAKPNTSGHIGVRWDRQRNKWEAQIKLNKKNHHLGRYESKDDAIEARKKASALLHGEFSRE